MAPLFILMVLICPRQCEVSRVYFLFTLKISSCNNITYGTPTVTHNYKRFHGPFSSVYPISLQNKLKLDSTKKAKSISHKKIIKKTKNLNWLHYNTHEKELCL